MTVQTSPFIQTKHMSSHKDKIVIKLQRLTLRPYIQAHLRTYRVIIILKYPPHGPAANRRLTIIPPSELRRLRSAYQTLRVDCVGKGRLYLRWLLLLQRSVCTGLTLSRKRAGIRT